MTLLSEALRLIQNDRADKDNRRRGEDSLRQREVEAMEKIASAVTPTHSQCEGK